MKLTTIIRNTVCASALAFAATSASAAIVTLDSVNGQWVSTTGGSGVTGIGTNQVRWGTPAAASSGGNGQKSGYTFDGAAPPAQTLVEDEATALGTFTHLNYTINDGTSISGASLELTFGLTVDGVSQTLTNSYNFAHWETSNTAAPCANSGANGSGINVNGCADRVQATLNNALAETFTVNGVEYTIDITGFNIPDQSGTPTFWTTERQSNSAQLFGSFSQFTPAPVPLPAAGLMLMAGLGGFAVVRRRKQQN